jgi:pyruvate kinase
VDAVIDALPEVSSVWVFTQSGSTARLIAHHRPRIPVIAFTPSESCYRRLSLVWGITPILTETVSNFRDLSDRVFPLALQHEIAERGDTVVVTGSHPFDSAAPTNFLKLHTV